MDFFSGSQPNLITNQTLEKMENMLKSSPNDVKNVKLADNLNTFYENYISPNLFFFILFTILAIYLYYRYWAKNKQQKEDLIEKLAKKIKRKEKASENKNLLNQQIVENKTNIINNDNVMDDVPSQVFEPFIANMNPAIPVSAQSSYTNYMDNYIPQGIGKNIFTYNQINPMSNPINSANFEYQPILHNKINRADTYTGLFNNYDYSVDQQYPNPFGWNADYNGSTFGAIQFATDRNQQNLEQLNQQVLFENMNLGLY